MLNLLESFVHPIRRRSGVRPRREDCKPRQLGVETLETRDLPSAGFGPLAVPDMVDRSALRGLAGDARYVELLYLDVLGRSAPQTELAPWVRFLSNGGTRSAVASAIDQSFEARSHLVKSWYLEYLGRPAQGGEERGWAAALLAGAPEDPLLANILGTSEFLARSQVLINAGSANERFVQALYSLFLNRTGNEAEVSGWVSALDSLGRGGAAGAVLTSPEARLNVIDAIYGTLLHRSPDPGGLNAFFRSNLNFAAIREVVEQSDEFFGNGQASSGITVPIAAPDGTVTIYNLHQDGNLDEVLWDPANPTAPQVIHVGVPREETNGARLVSIAAGTSHIDDYPMVVLLYNNGHCYEWWQKYNRLPSDPYAKWIVLSDNTTMIATGFAGFHGISVTLDGGTINADGGVSGNPIFNLRLDGSNPPTNLASFAPPSAEQGAEILEISGGTDAQGNVLVDAFFSDDTAWSWTAAAGWRQLGSSLTGVQAGLNGVSALSSAGQLALSQGPGTVPNTIAQFQQPFVAWLGSTVQGGAMLDFDSGGTISEVNESVNQGEGIPDLSVARFGAGTGGASAVVSVSGELTLFLDTTPAGGNLTIAPNAVLRSGAL